MIATLKISFIGKNYIHIQQPRIFKDFRNIVSKYVYSENSWKLPNTSIQPPFTWKIMVNQAKHTIVFKENILDLAKIAFYNKKELERKNILSMYIPKLIKYDFVNTIYSTPKKFEKLISSVEQLSLSEEITKEIIKELKKEHKNAKLNKITNKKRKTSSKLD